MLPQKKKDLIGMHKCDIYMYREMLTSFSGALFKGFKQKLFIKTCAFNVLEIELFNFFKE